MFDRAKLWRICHRIRKHDTHRKDAEIQDRTNGWSTNEVEFIATIDVFRDIRCTSNRFVRGLS